jgi:glycosyltransferase involved in cell wall biosynthesis
VSPDPREAPGPVRFVVSAVEPLRGMERAALDVAELLRADGVEVEVRVLTPGPPPLTRRQRAAGLTASFAGARAAVRDPASAVVLVGIWVGLRCLPWAAPRGGQQPPVVAWEHSHTRERTAGSRSFAAVAAAVLPLYRRRAAAVVAVSPAVAASLGPELAATAVVIPNPVAPEPAPPVLRPRPEGPVRLLALGGLVPVKQPHLLLDAVTALPPDAATLEVAGDGPLLRAVRTDAAHRGLGERVTFHGHVPDVGPLLGRADVLVHTSASETFGYALLEAAAAGLPVVAVENTQTRHLVPALVPGRTCPPSGEALAAAVRAVADEPEPARREAVERAWRARREAFDPAAVAAAWRAVLR